jgi:hypothetical protein
LATLYPFDSSNPRVVAGDGLGGEFQKLSALVHGAVVLHAGRQKRVRRGRAHVERHEGLQEGEPRGLRHRRLLAEHLAGGARKGGSKDRDMPVLKAWCLIESIFDVFTIGCNLRPIVSDSKIHLYAVAVCIHEGATTSWSGLQGDLSVERKRNEGDRFTFNGEQTLLRATLLFCARGERRAYVWLGETLASIRLARGWVWCATTTRSSTPSASAFCSCRSAMAA